MNFRCNDGYTDRWIDMCIDTFNVDRLPRESIEHDMCSRVPMSTAVTGGVTRPKLYHTFLPCSYLFQFIKGNRTVSKIGTNQKIALSYWLVIFERKGALASVNGQCVPPRFSAICHPEVKLAHAQP